MMLFNVNDLRGCAIRATDGIIGKVADFYFDDEDWGIRYLIVRTGSWLSRREVLISPIALGHADWTARQLSVALTRAQVQGSPDIDTRKPVSRQHEADHFAYYGYLHYWGGAGLWGMGAYPGSLTTQDIVNESMKTHPRHSVGAPNDCHLRSCHAVIGHRLDASDGPVGHVVDMLIDDYTWAIRHLVVGTTSSIGGEDFIVPPQWIDSISWLKKQVIVDMPRRTIEQASHNNADVRRERQEARRA